MLSKKCLAYLLLTAVCAAAAGANAPGKPERVTSVEGITEYRLGNGLRVLLFPDQTKQTITVNITYLVGSRNENYGETGMAHLLEHLMFKGTPKHPNIPQELTSHGARPNGTTWFDRTNYFETFQATDENLKWALELEADRMVNSFIAKKDLDSEMTVVRNEFETGENDPEGVLDQRVLSTAFLWHNYGHDTIGARADIENVPIERLQAFWRTYYQPDNAVLLVAGKFDEEQDAGDDQHDLLADPASLAAASRDLHRRADAGRRALGHAAARRETSRRWPSRTTCRPARTRRRRRGDPRRGPRRHALGPAAQGARRDEEGLVGLELLPRPEGAGLPPPARRGAAGPVARRGAKTTMLQTIDGAVKTPPTKEEVERARAKILKNIELTMNSADRVGLQMSEWIGAGDWRLFFLNRDRIRKVTPEDVQRVAAAYLKSSNRTVGEFIPTAKPDRAEIPATPDATALLKDYKGDAAVAAGEAFDPSPASIESRTARSTLPGGMKLALLPKKTRGATVVAAMTLRYGDEKSLVNRATAAQLAGAMLMRGTAKHTRQQIKDEFDRLRARVSINGGRDAGHRDGRDDAREPAGGPGARRGVPARADLPGDRVRYAEAGDAGRDRAGQERAAARSRAPLTSGT